MKLNSHPRISVVLPVFNDKKNIRLAVNSCLISLSSDDELLIVDDGSNDGTSEILSRLTDPRIRILKNETNIGLARSLNLGIQKAKNDYIGRMDADDICLPWRFIIQKKLIQRYDIDFLFGTQIWRIGPFLMAPVHTYVTRTNDSGVVSGLSMACILAHPTMLGKKSVIEELGMYPEVFAEDYGLWLSAALNKSLILRHWMPTVIYRMSRSSLSRKPTSNLNPLKHLTSKRLELAATVLGTPHATKKQVALLKRSLILKDPLLFIETGIFGIRGL